MRELYEEMDAEYDNLYSNVYMCAVFIEDVVYEELLKKYNLDKSKYMDPKQPLGIIVDGRTSFDYYLQKYVTTDILKSEMTSVVLEDEEGKVNLAIGKIINERPYYVSDAYELAVIYPYSMKDTALPGFGYEDYACDHYILSDDHKASFQDLKERLVEKGLSKKYLYDYAEGAEEDRTLILIINVFSYGFIVLISLIAAANVFNTISTNINLRRREFAMLKSVGMSQKEMNKMMNSLKKYKKMLKKSELK
jgi:putative ABC transport system permease protein